MWFVYWDPCGLVCYLFGWSVVLFVNYVTIAEVMYPWWGLSLRKPVGLFHAAVFQCIIFLILWSFIRAGFTDPGSVQCNTATAADAFPPESDPDRAFKPKRRICPKCNCIKPPRAHHCSTCGRCIVKMDHHCPWVNNCVGTNNLKHFLLFLLWVGVGATYAFTLSAWRFIYCWSEPRRCAVPSLPSIILVVAGAVLSVFFVIFVVAMACDQYEGVTTNTTAIESMKSWTEEHRSVMEGLVDVMGEPFSWRWFVPLPLPRDSPSFYVWKPTDDPDAYDRRDPVIQRHFRKIEEAHRLQQQQQQKQQPGGVDRAAAPGRISNAPVAPAVVSAESTSAPDAMGGVLGLTMKHRAHEQARAAGPGDAAASGNVFDDNLRPSGGPTVGDGHLRMTARGQARARQQ